MLQKVLKTTGVKTGKQYHKLFQISYHYQTILKFSENFYQTILTYSELISNSIHTFTELLKNKSKHFLRVWAFEQTENSQTENSHAKLRKETHTHMKQIILPSAILDFK